MESINDALIEAVKAAGGSKMIAPLLWPEMMMEAAQRKLLDCLNPERTHRLTPEQAFFVLRKANEAGRHASMEWACEHIGYSKPQPIVPRDEKAQLQKQFIFASAELTRLMKKLEAMA